MAYPTILTDADWQREKGIVAKMVGETGMGAAMTKCVGVYNAVDWTKLSVSSVYKDEAAIEQAKKDLLSEYAKMDGVRKALFALRDHAKGVKEKFQKSKLIPKSSVEHVDKIILACESFALECRDIREVLMPKFVEAEKRMLGNRAIALKIVTDQVPKVRNCIAGVLKNPTSANYSDTCWQPVRAFAAGVAKAPPLASVNAEWKTLSSIQPGTLKDANAVKAHAQKLDTLLTKTASAAVPH